VAVRNGVICDVLPRSSCFTRKSAGTQTASQVICANVDTVLVVTAVGPDLNARRIERYAATALAAGAKPIVVVNKTDLTDDAVTLRAAILATAGRVPAVFVSAKDGRGLPELLAHLPARETVALVGSSGVGKSSLVNRLMGEDRVATAAVRDTDGKGRHTTTRRELFVLPGGQLVIDTPGMREVGLWEASAGIDAAFSDVEAIAQNCQFRDCRHVHEPGCAVLQAVAAGDLAHARVANHQQLLREAAFQERRADERVARESKHKWRSMTKGMRARRKMNRKLGLKDF
jgi:ribosome biogenesis GTPase